MARSSEPTLFDDLGRLSLGDDDVEQRGHVLPADSSAGPSSRTPSSQSKVAGRRRRVRYTAFLLDDISRCSLLDWMRDLGAESPGDWTVSCDHVTIHHMPSAEQLANFPFGIPCDMRVLGVAGDERARAIHVEVPDFVPQPASAVSTRLDERGKRGKEEGESAKTRLSSSEHLVCLFFLFYINPKRTYQ